RCARTHPCSDIAMSDRVRRLAWTVAAVSVVWLGARIVLPGVNHVELTHVINMGGRRSLSTGALQQLSVFALGISPLVNAFLLVELAALIVPRWRPLRHGGPEGRRSLGRATACVAVAVAAVQAYFFAHYLEALSHGAADVFASSAKSRMLVMLSLVGGTMMLAWLISVI